MGSHFNWVLFRSAKQQGTPTRREPSVGSSVETKTNENKCKKKIPSFEIQIMTTGIKGVLFTGQKYFKNILIYNIF
jgi:hypothetical protein